MTELADLIADLVRIDSVNPTLVPGGAGEVEIAAFVAAWARDNGLEADVLEGTPGRPSVVVRARGTGGGRTLMLCAHLDTVGVEGMEAPHEPRIDGDRLHGRGAYDMKAGLAAALIAARDAKRQELAGDVVVAAVADEEHESLGVQEVLGAVRADAAIVTEPTEEVVAIAHKGFVWHEIEVAGVAAHGSRPHLGVDAITKAGPILTALGEHDHALEQRTHPLVGRASVHASTIAGGTEMSSYPASCVIGVERRTLPGERADDVDREVGALLRGTDATARRTLVREPFAIAADDPLVQIATGVTGTATGGVSYWADSAFIAAAGIPTILYGPRGEGAHAVEEWVSLESTARVARSLSVIAARFLQA